jgi:hypothetical protein
LSKVESLPEELCVTDVQTAVDALAAELAQPVLVEDPRHLPLWWSAQGHADPTRIRSILQREVTPAASALVARLGLPAAEGPIRTPADLEAEMLERWCVPLRAGRNLLGYLWVLDAEGLVTEADLPRLQECAEIATAALTRSRPSEETVARHRAALLARLAAEPDADAARELVALDDLTPDVTVTVHAPAASGGWMLRGGMSAHVEGERGRAATSGPPVRLVQLSTAVRRATAVRQSLRAGARLAAPTWDALGSWHLIVAAPTDLTVSDVHAGAEVLADGSHGDLLVTARVLLENGGDVASTAAELHIHRTTLYYRIERIEARTGVNLKAGAGRDHLLMALRLAAFRAAAG